MSEFWAGTVSCNWFVLWQTTCVGCECVKIQGLPDGYNHSLSGTLRKDLSDPDLSDSLCIATQYTCKSCCCLVHAAFPCPLSTTKITDPMEYLQSLLPCKGWQVFPLLSALVQLASRQINIIYQDWKERQPSGSCAAFYLASFLHTLKAIKY